MTMLRVSGLLAALALTGGLAAHLATADAATAQSPVAKDGSPAQAGGERTAVFAGGCFWGVEAVFEHVEGVSEVVSGYAGGSALTAHYALVGSGRTDHAEAVRVTYDPDRVSYGQLLKVFFSVAHDPTQLNRQGPDVGPQYRSAIFYGNERQKRAASAYIERIEAAGVYGKPVVTELVPLDGFHRAEDYHQDFARLHPDHPYIVYHDAPKVRRLQSLYPDLYAAR